MPSDLWHICASHSCFSPHSQLVALLISTFWHVLTGVNHLQATEETIWELFSPIGPILELYILRNNNGKSRGCAFVTYQTKAMAEKAITALNGCHMSSGKILVVKLADRSTVNKSPSATPPAANLLDIYTVA